jgi:hypothetical protein
VNATKLVRTFDIGIVGIEMFGVGNFGETLKLEILVEI